MSHKRKNRSRPNRFLRLKQRSHSSSISSTHPSRPTIRSVEILPPHLRVKFVRICQPSSAPTSGRLDATSRYEPKFIKVLPVFPGASSSPFILPSGAYDFAPPSTPTSAPPTPGYYVHIVPFNIIILCPCTHLKKKKCSAASD